MEHSGKNDHISIVRAMSLVLQLGLTVMVPLFLGVGAGMWLDGLTDSSVWTLSLSVLGLLGGARGAYVLAKKSIGKDEPAAEEYDLMAGWESDNSAREDGDEG